MGIGERTDERNGSVKARLETDRQLEREVYAK